MKSSIGCRLERTPDLIPVCMPVPLSTHEAPETAVGVDSRLYDTAQDHNISLAAV